MRLSWRAEDATRGDLYVGNIYVGSVNRMVPDGWREWPLFCDPPPEREAHVAKNVANTRSWYEKKETKPWRAWIMKDEDGSEHGWFATRDEARQSMEAEVLKQIKST